MVLSTTANDARPSASFSAQKNPQRIPANTLPVFPDLRPRIWPHLLCLVPKGNVGQAPRELLPLPFGDTILWHRRCKTSLPATHSVLQKVAHGATYACGRSSDRHAAQSPCLGPGRDHAAMCQSYVESGVSRRRPFEPKGRDHTRAQGPGRLYCDLSAPAGKSARSTLTLILTALNHKEVVLCLL